MPKKKPLKVTITISDKPYTKDERYRRWDMAIGDGYRAFLYANAERLLKEQKENEQQQHFHQITMQSNATA